MALTLFLWLHTQVQMVSTRNTNVTHRIAMRIELFLPGIGNGDDGVMMGTVLLLGVTGTVLFVSGTVELELEELSSGVIGVGGTGTGTGY